MMAIKLKDPSGWKRSSMNRWCDLVELHCLYGQDHFCSTEDAKEIIYFKQVDQESELREHSEKEDKINGFIEDVFRYLRYREKELGNLYPFKVTNDTIETKYDDCIKSCSIYIFLLLCSNLLFIEKSNQDAITKEFEICSFHSMKEMVSDKYQTHIFGTSRVDDVFNGSVRERIEKLADMLNTRTTSLFRENERYDVSGGDAGLDIVSFATLDSESFSPLIMAQCACSYDDWEKKQNDINEAKWGHIFESIAPYMKFLFVPFFWRKNTNTFIDKTEIYSCLFDRLRIMKIMADIDTYNDYCIEVETFIRNNQLDKANLWDSI